MKGRGEGVVWGRGLYLVMWFVGVACGGGVSRRHAAMGTRFASSEPGGDPGRDPREVPKVPGGGPGPGGCSGPPPPHRGPAALRLLPR